MCVGFFIALLDIQIVASSLQDIGGGLSAAQDEIAWVQTSYLIAEIIVIPLSGWLSRVISTRWLFCASAAGFTVTSLLCGWAWNIESMIVFRALQGFLGGSMIPTVFTTAFIFFQGPRRVIAAAAVGTHRLARADAGPDDRRLDHRHTIPGTGCSSSTWCPASSSRSWCRCWCASTSPICRCCKDADYPGMVLMAVFLGCLEYVLEEGPRWDWFGDATIRHCAWIAGDRRHRVRLAQPDLRHGRSSICARCTNRNFALGCFFSFVTGIGIFATIYLTPAVPRPCARLQRAGRPASRSSRPALFLVGDPVYILLRHSKFDLRWLMMFGLACFGVCDVDVHAASPTTGAAANCCCRRCCAASPAVSRWRRR